MADVLSFRRFVLAVGLVVAAQAAAAFGFEDVAARAKALAAQPSKPFVNRMPKELQDIDYDGYRDIRFRADRSLWRAEKLPFEVMFFHQGRAVPEPIRVNVVEPSGEREIAFDTGLFDYGNNKFDLQRFKEVGFNGLRIHHQLNSPKYKDELVVFQGASYFRALGKGHHYGLSARGLAVDTAEASGEEFPRFVEYWLERPKAGAPSVTLYALLDSKRVSGAYRFVIQPGVETVMTVTSRLFTREPIRKLGIAPLTSMYQFGENQPGKDDFRPEVHDSDGLSIQTGEGEWIWRPLVNPRRLLVTAFGVADPKGFGLLQRDRNALSYEDPEALYERRPSAWIEPIGAWGRGRVELVQIPTPDETNDNIVAYWVPEKIAAPGQPIDFSYRIRWQGAGPVPADKGTVVQSRRGRGFVRRADSDVNFVVDFDGGALKGLAADEPVEPVVWVDNNAEVRERLLFKNRTSGAWRMTVRLKRVDAGKPVEMRAYLKQQQKVLTETWSYIVPAEPERP